MKKSIIVLLLLCLSVAAEAAPYVCFSDLINGPKSGIGDGLGEGTVVTIWGYGFGSTQGTSKVYFKDSLGASREAAYVYYWKAADGTAPGSPAKLNTYFDFYEIAFSIPSASANGAGKIYVTVGSETSNEIDFYARSTGTFWFVKSDGSDAAAGTYSAPKLTVSTLTRNDSGIAAGDIIYVIGSYTHTATDGLQIGNAGSAISGTENNQIALVGYPNSAFKAISTGDVRFAVWNYSSKNDYWVFSKIETEGHIGGFYGSANGRIIGNECHGDGATPLGSGALIDAGADFYISEGTNKIDNLKVFGNYLRDFGTPAASNNLLHTMYFRIRADVRTLNAPEIAWNYLNDSGGPRFGIHFYDEGTDCLSTGGDGQPCVGSFVDTFKIHHNVVENQSGPGINIGTLNSEATPVADFPVEIYNNLLINCGKHTVLTSVDTNAVAIYGKRMTGYFKIYNNTIYGYGQSGEAGGAFNIPETGSNYSGFGGTYEFSNNIIVDTNNFAFEPSDYKTPTTMENNIWYSSFGQTTPAEDTDPITTNPLLVGGSPFDYKLQASSPAIGAGSNVSVLVVDDIAGTLRGVPLDIGAFEYAEGEAVPTHRSMGAKPGLLP